ncbi:MAG: tRNA (uridine(34)/cytosine(34)/5-carboxymethylaminomethyluridine(34)-2'-O)-methyltransferase TrmL [Pseudomonadota bacterium]
MFHVVLFEPEIPPNTGNIIRLCANTGSALHLIRPLGFDLDDKKLRRAGLDYRDLALVRDYPSLDRFLEQVRPKRLFGLSTKGTEGYTEAAFCPGDAFLFGPETRGLPAELMHTLATGNLLRIPMLASSRSMNLSNAVAVVLYEAWRQHGFAGIER